MSSPVWHPFTQHGIGDPIPLIDRAEGACLHTRDGRKIIDAISSWWVTTHGHCHPRIMAAIAEQAGKLDQIIFAGYTHELAETVARDLVAILPDPLAHVFFSDSGSTSVEVALKMALGYWRGRRTPRHRIIVMEGSYHGDTFGGMSVGERGVYNSAYQPLLFDVARLPFPRENAGQRTLDTLERICRDENPAALIVEPLILGAGGMLIYSPAVLAQMHAICRRHDVIFIADEVMTGWGRTGTLFACEQAQIVPDIICLSKGLTGGSMPLAVTVATPPIFEAHWSQDRADMLYHSSSYTANPIACAAAAANLAIWREEPVPERIAILSARQNERLAKIKGVHNARRLGTIAAFEMDDGAADYLSAAWSGLMAHFRERNLLIRPLGNTLYTMPPYCISEDDLDSIYAGMAEAMERFAAS